METTFKVKPVLIVSASHDLIVSETSSSSRVIAYSASSGPTYRTYDFSDDVPDGYECIGVQSGNGHNTSSYAPAVAQSGANVKYNLKIGGGTLYCNQRRPSSSVYQNYITLTAELICVKNGQ